MRIVKILSATVVTATVFGGVPAAQASVVINKKPAPSFDTTIKEGRKAVRSALKQTAVRPRHPSLWWRTAALRESDVHGSNACRKKGHRRRPSSGSDR